MQFKFKKFLYGITYLLIMPQINATIHVIGDSNSMFCFAPAQVYTAHFGKHSIKNGIPAHILDSEIKVHWIGAKTMFRVGRDGVNFLNFKKNDVKKNDFVIPVFGTIDVRCHILKIQEKESKSLDHIITQLVTNYYETIQKNVALYSNGDIKVIIFSLIPPTGNPDHINESYPIIGSLSDRVNITQMLNKKLYEKALNKGFLYLDVYDMFCNSDYSLARELSDGNIHINPELNFMIKDKLLQLISSSNPE